MTQELNRFAFGLLLASALSFVDCATRQIPSEPIASPRLESLSPALQSQILALDPEHVTAADVTNLLAHAPAPQIMNIRGGIYTVRPAMISFSRFLIGMGYPEAHIRLPCEDTWSFDCYTSADTIAGSVAWFYERDGLRPMMIGHSQGGMQTVKVLHRLAQADPQKLPVWNPVTWQAEPRTTIIDPRTGDLRPVVGLKISYASAVGAGGITRVLPNQWDMNGRLRDIPDTAIEFTGFQKNWDLLGGDFLGYGDANRYRATGTASVRNVRLPTGYDHGKIPNTSHLVENPAVRDWINNYIPADEPALDTALPGDTTHILWAADVWHSIKKHWVLELQAALHAQQCLGK